jgi:hypothetical protein
MYLYPCARIADAGPAAHTRRLCARACACAIGRPRIRAGTCERLPSASTAGGSARRRSTTRRRSTRTSARGTPRQSPRCPMYAPPFRPGRRATAGGTRSVGRRCGACRCARRRRRCTRVCVQTSGHVHALCVCMSIYVCIFVYALYIYINRYPCTCVRGGLGRACGCITSDAHVHAIARFRQRTVNGRVNGKRTLPSVGPLTDLYGQGPRAGR